MDDFSWVAPATKNIANIFGLNPELAARGRQMQAEQDLLAARAANTQADTNLSPYRQRLLEAQAGTQGALAGKYKADTSKTEAETAGVNMTNAARKTIADAIASGAIIPNDDGSMTISPGSVNVIGGALGALSSDPAKVMEGVRGLLGNAAKTPRAAAQTRGIPAAFASDASFSAKEGQDIQSAKEASATERARLVQLLRNEGSLATGKAVQELRNEGSLATAFARAGLPGASKAAAGVDQMELNRQSDAIKAGAEWAMKVPWAGGYLDQGQAYQLAQAARAANPTLNPQDAITKFVRDNPGLMKGNWELFGNNKVDFSRSPSDPAPAAATPAAAPAAAPAASAPAAAAAPATPAAAPAAAAAAPGGITKEKFEAMPEGGTVVIGGATYVKRGRQLVKVR